MTQGASNQTYSAEGGENATNVCVSKTVNNKTKAGKLPTKALSQRSYDLQH
jgi:hypothetical protein